MKVVICKFQKNSRTFFSDGKVGINSWGLLFFSGENWGFYSRVVFIRGFAVCLLFLKISLGMLSRLQKYEVPKKNKGRRSEKVITKMFCKKKVF